MGQNNDLERVIDSIESESALETPEACELPILEQGFPPRFRHTGRGDANAPPRPFWPDVEGGKVKMIERVSATPKALALIELLRGRHGGLLFHQSGGCCDGSAPMCYPAGEFKIGSQDVLMGEIGGAPFHMSRSQFEYWKHTHLIIDVVDGRGSGFSLEAPEGVRFLTRSRLFTDDELAQLAASEAGAS